MFGDSGAREAGRGCVTSVTDLHCKVPAWAAQPLPSCCKWPGWKGLRNSVWPGLGWEKPTTNKTPHSSSVAKWIFPKAQLGWFMRSYCQGWAAHQHRRHLSHFLSNSCSHHHSAVTPWTVSLTSPEEADDCKNQDSHKDATDEGQWHVQYFTAVDTQKILSEPSVSTEGLKPQ